MTKHHRISMSSKRLISFLSLIITTAVSSAAYADTPNCQVGNTSQGYWSMVSLSQTCAIPGPPAGDSPWPKILGNGSFSDGSAYRIEGLYKIVPTMSSEGFSWSIPHSRPTCITGYAEAYTAVACAQYQSYYPDPQLACCHTTYTASGSVCSNHYTDNRYGFYEYYNYARFYEGSFYLYEWICNPAQPVKTNSNEGPPPCPVPSNNQS